MSLADDPVERLKAWLSKLAVGPDDAVPPAYVDEIEKLLAAAWPSLMGYEEGMKPEKLRGRMEEIHWKPPVLSFAIERHGRTVMGSTRADLQYWDIDLNKRERTSSGGGYRQLYPMASRVNVSPLAEDVARAIVQGQQDDPRLRWKGPDRVRVIATEVLPAYEPVYERTQSGRRKRLWEALEKILQPKGWKRDKSEAGGVFIRTNLK
ncbi:MAG: hypothetical protein M0Z41_18765 [Peptococcaceae bacterium]|jgi:hypothetical protein|nr:hypothetical protein [Peptococcaceae bacterium]